MLRPLRVLLQPLLVALLVSSASTSSVVSAAAAPTTCKRLTDATSPFVLALQSAHGVLTELLGGDTDSPPLSFDPRVFAAIDTALPSLSMCVAETDPLDLITALKAFPAAKKCWYDLTLLDQATARPSPTSRNSNSNSNSGDDDKTDVATVFHDEVCPAIATIAPCLTDVLIPAIELVMANTHGCCDALTRDVTAAMGGASLRDTASSIVRVVGNALCSQRKHEGSKETCGDALTNNWVPPSINESEDDEKAMWAVLDGFQIPNDQVCKAVASEPYRTTTGKTQQFGAPGQSPYGACVAPMETLLQYVRDLPLWTSGSGTDAAVMDKLFGDQSCLPGKQFVSWAANEQGVLLQSVRRVDVVVNAITSLFVGDYSASPMPAPTPTLTPTLTPTADASNSNSNSNSGDSSSDYSRSGDDSRESSGSGDASNASGSSNDQEAFDLFDTMGETDDSKPLEKQTMHRRLQEAGSLVEITQSFLKQLEDFANDICIHLPTNVTCDIPGETLELPFPLGAANSTPASTR